MVDLDLLSDPFLFLFLLLLAGAGALIFFLILFKVQLEYLQEVSAFCRCSCSSSRCCLVEHISLALWNNVLMTLYLAVVVWWLSHCKYWLVWVGFLSTMVSMLPSAWIVIRWSRKGMNPSALVFSAVNWMPSSMELMWLKNSSLYTVFMTAKVSSTDLFHKLQLCGAELRDLVTKSYMKMLAIMGLNGDPIAAPSCCS